MILSDWYIYCFFLMFEMWMIKWNEQMIYYYDIWSGLCVGSVVYQEMFWISPGHMNTDPWLDGIERHMARPNP